MVTTEGLHEVVAVRLSLDANEANADKDFETLLLGDDDSSFNTTDTSLNNQIGEITITDPMASGSTYEINEFLSANELNGETIRELAIETADGTVVTHDPPPSPISKDQSIVVLFNCEITMSDV